MPRPPEPPYVGRFAPSPTGPLHLGSLVAALGSYLDARANAGRWLVRVEDLDPPREQPGAAELILDQLRALGLNWDGAVLQQSGRHEAYAEAAARLQASGQAYPCACSRSEVAAAGRRGPEGPVYPGTCRNGLAPGRKARAVRVRCAEQPLGFEDLLRGPQRSDLAREIGDYVVRRADGPYAYQLAVVVDDAAQGVTHVVRGADLLASTARQIHLQRLLGLRTPRYAHLPLICDARGQKLGKQTGARAIDTERPVPALFHALSLLGQSPPPGLFSATRDALLAWAVAHWRLDRVPREDHAEA
jgi:glutamyl-Q tRNA(Asp) synthetase